MTNGYIAIYRSLMEWKYHDVPTALSLWVHILLSANWKDGYFRGQPVPAGTFVTSIRHLQDECGIESNNTIRKWLKIFEKDGMISLKSTNKFTSIKVINYAKYQLSGEGGCTTDCTTDCTQYNNNNNNNKNKKIYSRAEPDRVSPSSSHFENEAREILDYLNTQAGKRYTPVANNLGYIEAKLQAGYTVDDCKTVIDKKCTEWKDTEMDKYLRCATLFTDKFEAYLNQQPVVQTAQSQSWHVYELPEYMKHEAEPLEKSSEADIAEVERQREALKERIAQCKNIS